MAELPRVVMVGPMGPHDRMPTAGGTYVHAVRQALSEYADVTALAPDDPVNRRALSADGLPTAFLLVGRGDRRLVARAARFVAQHVFAALHRFDVAVPHLSYAVSLVLDPRARRTLRDADVVDLQFSEYIRLVPLLRLLAPRARLVGTFHDVLSQRYRRYVAAREPSAPLRTWRTSAWLARRSEQAALRRLDVAATLNDKDAALLGGRTVVLDPPLWNGSDAVRARAGHPVVLFVGALDREDNQDAVAYLLDEVWPAVLAHRPEARLRIVGAGAGSGLADVLGSAPGVEAPGFVDDLPGEYAAAWCVVVPLRLGAGVKFKTIEALVAGVPTVTTTIGAEGIPAARRLEVVTDDPAVFAAAVRRVLDDPAAADARAETVRSWACERYSAVRFRERVGSVYGLR